jgi:predicted nucleic-acid-binding protein
MIKFSEMIKESKNITCYHVSQDSDIKVLRGYYSAKFRTKGIFVSLSFKSALEDWAPFVAGKKGHKKDRTQDDPQYYKTLTIYKLSAPQEIVNLSKDIHTKAANEYQKERGNFDTYAAFYWGSEIFIPEQFLDNVQIVGRETKRYQEIVKRQVHDYKKERDISIYSNDSFKIAKELYHKNIAARYYVNLKDKSKNYTGQSQLLNKYFQELAAMFLIFYNNNPTKKTNSDLTEQDKVKIEELKNKIEDLLNYKGLDDGTL